MTVNWAVSETNLPLHQHMKRSGCILKTKSELQIHFRFYLKNNKIPGTGGGKIHAVRSAHQLPSPNVVYRPQEPICQERNLHALVHVSKKKARNKEKNMVWGRERRLTASLVRVAQGKISFNVCPPPILKGLGTAIRKDCDNHAFTEGAYLP